jgi:hypothetical protein
MVRQLESCFFNHGEHEGHGEKYLFFSGSLFLLCSFVFSVVDQIIRVARHLMIDSYISLPVLRESGFKPFRHEPQAVCSSFQSTRE